MQTVQELPKTEIEYIELKNSMSIQICSRRTTTIYEGACGYILNKENIPTIWGISIDQQTSLLERLEGAEKDGKIFALIAGFPLALSKHQFIRKKAIGTPRIPWELII